MSVLKSISIAVSTCFILCMTGLAGMAVSTALNPPDTGTNHALVIGIGNYDRWDKLTSPARDAEAVAGMLIRKYDFRKTNVTLLTDNTPDKPTLTNIINHLDDFSTRLTERDNLLIFFSGHSFEDDEGETYWIPKNGKKRSKLTWLKHSAIAEEYLISDSFKVKNLCVVTDSDFIGKRLRSRPISLTPFDLRYEEKIAEKAARSSREVIFFGDVHWPGNERTQGLGLFTYYFHKALDENTLGIIDIENLIFEEDNLFTISKIAGTKLAQGRFRSSLDTGGQFIIRKTPPAQPVQIIKTDISPRKGYPGENFIIRATTDRPASEVIIELHGKMHKMAGNGVDWQYKTPIDSIGSTPFLIAAVNEKDVAGKSVGGSLETIKRRAAACNIQTTQVEPRSGYKGDNYNFTATTDRPAKLVELTIGGKRYRMKGAGTGWSLIQKIDHIGSVNFSVVATNEDGVQGKSASGRIQLAALPVSVLSVTTSPESGFAGEEFTINARTDRQASSVIVELDGETHAMKGSGKRWVFKKTIDDIGTKRFSIRAENEEGKPGAPAEGRLRAEKSPVPIPDVASVDVKLIGPGKGYPGDSYEFLVSTSAPSQTVSLVINEKTYPMQGSNDTWRYVTRIDKLGSSSYRVLARNSDGAQGQSRDGEITTVKKPLAPVNVLTSEIVPSKGYAGKVFTFKATTDRPARSIKLIVGKRSYEMTGGDTSWQASHKVDQIGNINVVMVARNADDVDGPVLTTALTVEKEIKGYRDNRDGTVTHRKTGNVKPRFVDNGDGTITDRLTSLMWLKRPKTIPVSFEKATQYCRNLDFKGFTGWRLPTISEWRRLIDRKYKNPALPPNHPFDNVLTHVGYWSKSKHKFGPRYAFQMNLWYGKSSHSRKSEDLAVWPVRYVELSEEG